MKVTALRTTPVSIPYSRPARASSFMRSGVSVVVVELETDEGLTGVGECLARPSVAMICEALRLMEPFVLGKSPHDVESFFKNVHHGGNWDFFERIGHCAMNGIETALYDLQGKAAGQPVCALLGGWVRNRIGCMRYLFWDEPESLGRQAREAVEAGYRTLYLKIGHGLEKDVEAAEAVRDAVGSGCALRVDANEAYTASTAIRLLRAIRHLEVEFIEQPVPKEDVEGLARVRREGGVRVAADQALWNLYDVHKVIAAEAADLLVLCTHFLGGLLPCKKAAAVAEAAGLGVLMHAAGELGVGTAAAAHLAASTPNFYYDNQTGCYVPWLEDDITAGGLPRIERGWLEVPCGPGLGVELDPDRMRRWAAHHDASGGYAGRESVSEVLLIPKA